MMSASIWVDADACPVVIREILFKAARRTAVPLTLVANQSLPVPGDANIRSLQVSAGFDEADHEIVRRAQAGDLVITSDIPLADELLAKDVLALSPRGELFSKSSIKAKLGMRDFMETLRGSGIHTGGPDAMNASDRQAFANQLDRWLTRALKR